MKKIIAVSLCLLTLVLCLTGCVYEGVDVKLNKGGTGTVSTTVGIEKEYVNEMLDGQNPFEGKETEEIEYDGKTYISYTESVDYKTYDDITKALLAMTYDTNSLKELSETEDSTETVTATEPQAETPAEPSTDGATDAATEADTPTTDDAKTDDTASADSDNHIFKSVSVKNEGGKYVFSAVLNRIGGKVQGYSMKDIFKMNISVEMPGKVTAYKNGTVDGNKVTFDLSDMSEETELYAECKETSKIPAIVGIVLAVIAVVVFIILKKKK